MIEIKESILDILEVDLVSRVTAHKLGGMLNQFSSLDLDQDLQNLASIIINFQQPDILGDLVHEVLVSEL